MTSDLLSLMWVPFLMCLVLTGIHAYLGFHVIAREVVFVDIALAQIAALGATAAFLFGYDLETWASYAFALGFTILGALVLALTRSRRRHVSQEAVIGVVYAVSSGAAYRDGWRVRWWDFLFYASFGIVVTSSVRIAGVLLVFSYLIVPALAGILLGRTVTHKLIIGWAFGTLVSMIGMTASAVFDFPTGATVVCAFGLTLIVLWIAFQTVRPASGRLTPSA